MLIDINNNEFKLFQEYLLKNSGINIPIEKKYLFRTRLSELINAKNLNSFGELYQQFKNTDNQELQNKIIEVMTTNETSFFRDGHPFETFQNIILPEIIKQKSKEALHYSPKIRIWSAACSTGQEPYSVAMILMEMLKMESRCGIEDVYILSTDISSSVLNRARKGLYTDDEVKKGMKDKYKGRYITRHNESLWEITDDIKKMVDFKELNLSKDFSDNLFHFDIIFCRNLIIYFLDELKRKVIEQFHRLLNPKGILIIGAAENLYGISDDFEVSHNGKTTIYRTKK